MLTHIQWNWFVATEMFNRHNDSFCGAFFFYPVASVNCCAFFVIISNETRNVIIATTMLCVHWDHREKNQCFSFLKLFFFFFLTSSMFTYITLEFPWMTLTFGLLLVYTQRTHFCSFRFSSYALSVNYSVREPLTIHHLQ